MNNYNFEQIQQTKLSYSEIMEAFKQDNLLDPPSNIPFPQANSIEKLVRLVLHLNINNLASNQIAKLFNFTERQAHYYTSAGIYFGLVEKTSNNLFTLSSKCKLAVQNSESYFIKYFISSILRDKVFNDSFAMFIEKKELFSKEDIYYILLKYDLQALESESTYKRRASTVFNYVIWISKRL